MQTSDDDRRVEEIERWFDERGYDLYVHEVGSHGWRAPYMLKGSRIGSADYGVGNTPREAAEDAQARYTRDNTVEVSAIASMPMESTQGVSKKIGIAVETDTAMPITASKTKAIGQAAETDTLCRSRTRRAAQSGRRSTSPRSTRRSRRSRRTGGAFSSRRSRTER